VRWGLGGGWTSISCFSPGAFGSDTTSGRCVRDQGCLWLV
jgi:hypothetical protein